jgi:potassium-transporting ATPase KdpC subunit
MNKQNSQRSTYDDPSDAKSPGFIGEMFTHVRISIVATIVLGIIVSGIYPLIVWGLAQVLFPHQANGSLIKKDGTPTNNDTEAVGSALLGQPFSDSKYFHPRPSAAGNGYDPTSSGGTNLGPLSAKLLLGTTKAATQPSSPDVVDFDGISDRVVHYCIDNGIAFDSSLPIDKFKDKDGNLDDVKLIKAFNDSSTPLTIKPKIAIPADAVTASASGLDPHISAANAEFQAQRVADARKLPVDRVKALIAQYTDGPDLGILGDAGVNVLKLNVALDNQK